MHRFCRKSAIFIILMLVLASLRAAAQTRASEIEEERSRKARSLQVESVSGLENLMLQIKQRKVIERITAGYNGLRVQIGNMATGSGFALGPEFFREDLRDGQIHINASFSISTHGWQKYSTALTAPRLLKDRLLLRVEATRRDYRSLEFYGIGDDSARDSRSSYALKDTSLDGTAVLRFGRNIRMGGSLGGLWADNGGGDHPTAPSIETFFDDTSAPGLGRQTRFLRASVLGQIDYRDDPAGPKAGGNYVSEYTWLHDVLLNQFSFDRWDVDLQQYVPLFNKSRRFALRARMTMTRADPGQRVPFYMMPYVGGADDLRGFRPYRFGGPNSVVYNAEYRWEIFSGLDGALFYDAAKVLQHRWHLGMGGLRTSAGFGLRFNARNRTFMRLDVGFSGEGTCVWLKFNDPFTPLAFGAGTRQPLY